MFLVPEWCKFLVTSVCCRFSWLRTDIGSLGSGELSVLYILGCCLFSLLRDADSSLCSEKLSVLVAYE